MPMDPSTLARVGAIVFIAIAITAAIIEATRTDASAPAPSATSVTMTDQRDPLGAELTRCSEAGEAATRDPACLKVWEQNRRRFLGQNRGN